MPDLLQSPSTLVIFATAPTGLGHLRVSDALSHGLSTTPAILLGAQDRNADTFYRYISNNHLSSFVMNWAQNGSLSYHFMHMGRRFLHSNTTHLYHQVVRILGEQLVVPQTIILIATHNTIAHQLGAIKEKLTKETKASILLVVQVTDDSPQPFWYVPEADLITVPSEHTKTSLQDIARKMKLGNAEIAVTAYPISPLLTTPLTAKQIQERRNQLSPTHTNTIAVSVPLSGAAVGTSYTSSLLSHLHTTSKRYHFHLVAKEAPFTKPFLTKLERRSYITLSLATHDRTTISNYETLFEQTVLSLEITKPSEQSFKVLATPKQRGGVILLFSKPYGQQEHDNIAFFRRHHIIPSVKEQEALWHYAQTNQTDSFPLFAKTLQHWRGLCLPDDPKQAAQFITWCQTQNIFQEMGKFVQPSNAKELQPNGVEQFWTKVERLMARDQ